MKTSSFLRELRQHGSFPLTFHTPSGAVVAPGYHLTEVKRVAYDTVDCGAEAHRWAETQFEIRAPSTIEPLAPPMAAGKFLGIVDRVERQLPLDGDAPARVFTSFPGQPAALFDINRVEAHDGTLTVTLSPDRTRCKASERAQAAAGQGCCGSAADQDGEQRACGCSTTAAASTRSAATCCA
jgi:hypothetical protein